MPKRNSFCARLNRPIHLSALIRTIGNVCFFCICGWLFYDTVTEWASDHFSPEYSVSSIFWIVLASYGAWASLNAAAVSWREWRRQKRWQIPIMKGTCPGCGYPVRDWSTGSCPECGYFLGICDARPRSERLVQQNIKHDTFKQPEASD